MSNQLETALMGCVEEALMRDEYWEENPHYQCEECGKKCKCRMDFCQCDEFVEKSLHYCDYECEGECGTDEDTLPTICDECLGLDEPDEDQEGEEEGKVCKKCGEFNLWKKYSFQIDVKNALTWIMTDECADCYEEEL